MKTKEIKKENSIVTQEIIEQKIYLIRGKKVMLDKDLAVLYGVETKTLKRAVKRNIERFPEDFMFQLGIEETKILRYQFGTLEKGQYSKYLPFAFTEQGVAMLAGVLKSKRAIEVNVQIIRTFVKLREMIISNKELRAKIEEMERKYDKRFKAVFDTLRNLLESELQEKEVEKRSPIGFKIKR